uniref:Bulb-type lectin domain-containing protein n=1 Tax=Salmo trutta TaxID=8032 RepID=A0A674CX72_SALTR
MKTYHSCIISQTKYLDAYQIVLSGINTDGNFVLYGWGRVVWASNTENKDAQRLILQQDGNLVIYTTQDRPIWASNTGRCNNTQRGHLTLTDKGTLELYGDGEVIWTS